MSLPKSPKASKNEVRINSINAASPDGHIGMARSALNPRHSCPEVTRETYGLNGSKIILLLLLLLLLLLQPGVSEADLEPPISTSLLQTKYGTSVRVGWGQP
jgi:hypothetical protein